MTNCKYAYSIAAMTEHWSLQYVRAVCDQIDARPSALAGMIGVSSTTLTRPLNNPDHKHKLGRDTLDKIAAKTGISYEPFRANSSRDTSDLDINRHEFEERLSKLSPARRLAVLQYLADQEALHEQASSQLPDVVKSAEK